MGPSDPLPHLPSYYLLSTIRRLLSAFLNAGLRQPSLPLHR